jgi:ureidoacrylate peracid hydrolase
VFAKSTFLNDFDNSRAVLLVIDMQNDFVQESAPMEVPMAREWIPNIQRLVRACRENNIPVIYTQHTLLEELNVSPIERMKHTLPKTTTPEGHEIEAKSLSYCIKGTLGHQIIAELEPHPSEIIVQKHRYDAFYNTNLDTIVKNIRGHNVVNTIIIVGTLTNVCCESTARSAFMRDYKVLFVSDGNGGINETSQQATLQSIEQAFGEIVTTDKLVGKIQS